MFSADQKQDLLNKACNIIIQNNLSLLGENGVCMYRGINNTRCALGWSIEDDAVAEKYELSTPSMVDGQPNGIAKVLGAEDEKDVQFLIELQQCHDPILGYKNNGGDRSKFKYLFAGALYSFADRYALSRDYITAYLQQAEKKEGII
jgi:hypothetical protein